MVIQLKKKKLQISEKITNTSYLDRDVTMATAVPFSDSRSSSSFDYSESDEEYANEDQLQGDSSTDNSLFACFSCNKGFPDEQMLQAHACVKSSGSFKSDLCQISFTQESNLNSHIAKSHTEELLSPFVCKICKKRFTAETTFQNHMLIHSEEKNHECDTHGKKFHQKSALHSLIHVHSGINQHSEKRFMCDLCEMRFSLRISLKMHIMKIHREEKSRPFVCEICQKGFPVKSNLEEHLLIHSGEKKYECDICRKKFHEKSTLLHHIRVVHSEIKQRSEEHMDNVHTKEKAMPFVSETYEEGFSVETSLEEDMLIPSAEKNHECDICEKKFRFKSVLLRHIRGVHARLKCPYAKPVFCDICKKKFSEKSSLKRHMNNIHVEIKPRPYVCEICQKGFTIKKTLQDHMLTHSEEKNYGCDTCEKRFRQKCALIRHIRVVHEGIKCNSGEPFICNLCQMRFTQKSSLRRHMKNVHTEEKVKPFVCDICQKGFTLKASLQDHVLIHTGEKHRECDTCGKKFRQKSALRQHIHAMHIRIMSHFCDICQKTFPTRGNMMNHVRSVHNKEKKFGCDLCSEKFTNKSHLMFHSQRFHTTEQPHVMYLSA